MSATKLLSGRTILTEKKRFNTPAGSGMKDEYAYDVNDKGEKILVLVGQKNLYAEIQSYAEDCKIENILKRVAVGDMSDFRPDGIYADTTKMPNNLIEAKKQMVKLENTWNNLPTEIKEKYDNSLDKFIGAAGSEAWMIDMGFLNPAGTEKTPTIKDTIPETTPEVPDTK